jgi:hypothetical protein
MRPRPCVTTSVTAKTTKETMIATATGGYPRRMSGIRTPDQHHEREDETEERPKPLPTSQRDDRSREENGEHSERRRPIAIEQRIGLSAVRPGRHRQENPVTRYEALARRVEVTHADGNLDCPSLLRFTGELHQQALVRLGHRPDLGDTLLEDAEHPCADRMRLRLARWLLCSDTLRSGDQHRDCHGDQNEPNQHPFAHSYRSASTIDTREA